MRKDNTLENAKYLGYLDSRELYPDMKPVGFSKYIEELLEGKGERPYANTFNFESFERSKESFR